MVLIVPMFLGGLIRTVGRAVGGVARVASGFVPGGSIVRGLAETAISAVTRRGRPIRTAAAIPPPSPFGTAAGRPTVRNIERVTRAQPVLRRAAKRATRTARLGPMNGAGAPAPAQRAQMQMQDGCPSNACCPGTRLNRSDYFLRDGTFVERGTRCVSTRRMNPGNAQAARRAVRRLKAFDKLARQTQRELKRLAR